MMSWASVKSDLIEWSVLNFAEHGTTDNIVLTDIYNSETLDAHFQLKVKFHGIYGSFVELYLFSSRDIISEVKSEYFMSEQIFVAPCKREYLRLHGEVWNELDGFDIMDFCRYDGVLHCCLHILEFKPNLVFNTPIVSIGGRDILCRLSNLLSSKEHSDLEIQSSDKRTFEAHQLILKCSSPVFAAMLQHNMIERNASKISIDDVNGSLVQEMLSYIYTGTCLNISENAENLISVAEKYMLFGLKDLCEEALIGKVRRDTAIKLYILADKFDTIKLKQKIWDYVVETSNLGLFLDESHGTFNQYLVGELILNIINRGPNRGIMQ